MESRWEKIWYQVRDRFETEKLESRRGKRSRESIHVHALGKEQLDLLEKTAEKRHIPISQAIQEAVDLYTKQETADPLPKINEERKERNPLLRLEGLCGKRGLSS
ncbi:hypothetical protein [Ammoniphilus sp. CFH 90114]|uniref:hypothetical protein n=1 Tax=Ammoniphilus sp. CFH 90114 TaxID=2493665 RepID=UPI00100F9BAC|nr:hypothetical protein [Ammoniphilus sp. CFH 90114]RXT06582.1 hypothetical protein EIZ39_16105 [Ammoniphilus sp. CFH 90114]